LGELVGGDRLDLAALSFDGGVMQPKSSVFQPNYFLLKGKVEIGRTFLSDNNYAAGRYQKT